MGDRSCVALIEDDLILMVRQIYRGETFWTFPGDSIEPGETPEMAAIREAKEEVGLDAKIIRLLCRTPRTIAPGVYSCYLGQIVGDEIALRSDPELHDGNQELHEVRLVPLEQVQEHPEVVRILVTLAQLPSNPVKGLASTSLHTRS